MAMAAASLLMLSASEPALATSMEAYQLAESEGTSSALLQRYAQVKGSSGKAEGAKGVLKAKVQEAKKAATNAPKAATAKPAASSSSGV